MRSGICEIVERVWRPRTPRTVDNSNSLTDKIKLNIRITEEKTELHQQKEINSRVNLPVESCSPRKFLFRCLLNRWTQGLIGLVGAGLRSGEKTGTFRSEFQTSHLFYFTRCSSFHTTLIHFTPCHCASPAHQSFCNPWSWWEGYIVWEIPYQFRPVFCKLDRLD
jgi:hypothetical protein